jgi:hypothetical protein
MLDLLQALGEIIVYGNAVGMLSLLIYLAIFH